MDVQAELANAIKQRFQAVNGVEAPRQSGRSSRRRSPEPMPKADKAAKNEAKKAAAAAIMARMGGGKPASPPRAEKKRRSLKMPFSKPKISANVANSTAKGPLSKQEEETAQKYRKMMKMGLPEGAVVHKMSQDGVSQRIVDAVLSGENASPPPPVSRPAKSSSSSSRAALSPAEEKIAAQYRRMLKIKMPEGAVLHKMIADGVSAHIRDSVMARDEPARQALPARGAGNQTKQLGGTTSSLSPQEEKIAAQYRRMLKIKMPEGAVKHKMVVDGVSQKIQDSVMGGEVPTSPSSSSPLSSSRGGTTGPVSSLSREDELVAAPYRKMIKMKMPEGAVRHKMSVDRIPERIQKSVLNGEIPNEISHAAPPPGRRPANPMASAINMSGGIESLKKGSSSSRGHPMAAAISSSGGIGSLKKASTQDAPARPPSNPMAAAIASSGGLKSLKKTSVKEKKAPAAPSNPIAAAIAASKGKNSLKKTTPNNLQPRKPKSGNSVLDELSSKGFKSGLRKTTPKTSPSTSPYSSPESSNSDSLADEPVPRRAPRASPDRDSSRPVNPRRSPERNHYEEDDRPRRSYGIRVKAIRPVGTTNETKEDDIPSRFSAIKVKAIRPVGTSRFEEDDRPSRYSNIKVKAVRPVGTSRVEGTPERNSKYETKEDDPPRRSYKVKSVRPTGVSSSVANEVPGKRISLNKEDEVPRNWRAVKTKSASPPEEQPKSSTSTYIPYESKKNASQEKYESKKSISQEKYESKKSITREKYESKKGMQEKYPSRSATSCRSTASRSTASTKSTTNSDFQNHAANLEKNFASAVQESMRTQRTVPDYSGRSASRTKGRTSTTTSSTSNTMNHKNRKKRMVISKTGRKKRHVTTADGVDHHFQCIVM